MRTPIFIIFCISIALLALVSCAAGATCSLASTTATGYIGYNFTGVFSKDGSLSGDLDYVPFPYKCGIHYSSGTWSEDSTAATVTLSLSGCERSSCTLAPACNGNYDLTLSRVQWAADCRSFNCTLTATTSDVTVFTVTPAPASTVNKAALIGLIVGALVAGCVLIFCCCWCCNRSSASRRRQGGAGYGQLNNNGAPMPVNGTASYVPPSYTPTPGAPMTPPAPQVMSPQQQQQPYRATTGALPGGPQAMPPRAVTAPAPAGHPVVYAGVPMGAQVPPPMYAAAPPAYAPAYAAPMQAPAPPPMAYAPPAAPSGYAPSAPPSGEAPPPGYFDAPPPMTSPYGSGVEKQ